MDKQSARAADQQTMEDWIPRYGDQILRLCFLWLKDLQLAEDAMQDTFFKAWQALPRFLKREEGGELAWLSAIAVNTCRDALRGSWFKRINRAVALSDLPPAAFAVSDEDRDLYLVISQMPQKHREILLLYYYLGLNLRECGQALRINPSSAHHRLKKAEGALKTQLEGGPSHA